MRKLLNWLTAFCVVSSTFILPFGCQREAKNELVEKGKIPVTISEYSRIHSRVSGSSFETEDQIGLYIMEQPGTLSESRFVDNECFHYKDGQWIGKEKIYYPSSSGVYDFIAYYPYHENGVAEGESTVTFEVATNQQQKENYMKSDLLIAGKKGVEPSFDAVPLIFKHKLVEINIELLPGDAYHSATELLAANPSVMIKSVATRTDYDFITETFSNPSLKADVTPFGGFVAEDNKLVGVRAILVPQTIEGNHLLLEIKCGSKVYSFTFGTDHVMEPATRETYTLTMRKNSFEGSITASIEDWGKENSIIGDLNEEEEEEDNNENKEGFVFTIPDFTASSVYKLMNGTTQIAEICREYLRGTNINNQAVVVYAFKDGKADLSAGFVVQVLQEDAGAPVSESIHGGTVSWKSGNTLSYQAGNQQAISRIYMDIEGNLTATAIQNAQSVSSMADIILDTRDNREYPIVKVGNQYWMGENLYATSFTNGEALRNASAESLWKSIQSANPIVTAAYSIESKSQSLYYNYVAVSSGMLAPEGWKIPSSAEWTSLKNYVKDREAFISHNWEGATNLSGLAIEGWGYRMDTGMDITAGKAYFWADTQERFEVTDTSTSIKNSTKDGNSVRCIRM